MKKQISILFSVILVMSMIFSVTVQASSGVQIKEVVTYLDMAKDNVSLVTVLSTVKDVYVDGVKNLAMSISHRGVAEILAEPYFGYDKVLRLYSKDGKAMYMSFDPLDKSGTKKASLSDGIYTINAKFRTDSNLKTRDWYINYGLSDKKVQAIPQLLNNIWYDLEYVADMTGDGINLTITYTPELSASSAAELSDSEAADFIESNTIKTTANYSSVETLSTIKAYVYGDTGNSMYWSQIKISYCLPMYNKAEVLEIGSAGEVAYDQNNVIVKLSDNIPGLKQEHISIASTQGQDIAISSMGVSSDATINITTANPLPAWSQFNLVISSKAWGENSTEILADEESEVTDVFASFYTPASGFDMKEPTYTLAGNELTIDTALVNTSGTAEDITLLVVVYGDDGRVKSVKATSFNNFEAASPGEDKSVTITFENGDTAKILAVNGWTNKTALFGKFWQTSYAELN